MASDQSLRDRYKLSWVPVGLGEEQLAKYSDFLAMTIDERSVVQKSVSSEEYEVLSELELARVMYNGPVDHDPERYK